MTFLILTGSDKRNDYFNVVFYLYKYNTLHTIRSFASSTIVYCPDSGMNPIHDPSRIMVYIMSPVIYKQAKQRATVLDNCSEASIG